MALSLSEGHSLVQAAQDAIEKTAGPSTALVQLLRVARGNLAAARTGGIAPESMGSAVALVEEINTIQEQQQARMASLLHYLRTITGDRS
jgi:hypothetical protein